MRKRMLLNDFSEIAFDKGKAILLIEENAVLEIEKNNGFLLTALDENEKEEVGIGVAFNIATEDERESLPVLFSYYISKEKKSYRLMPLLSSMHLGCAAGWFFLLRGLKQNREFVIDALKIATISYNWNLDKAPVDLSQAEAMVNTYLFQKFGREAIPYIVQQEINKIRAAQLKRIESFQKAFLDVLAEQGKIKGDVDLIAFQKLESIVRELERKKEEIQNAYKEQPIMQYAVSAGANNIPVLVHTVLFWDGEIVKLRIFVVVPSKNLPSPEKVIATIKEMAKGDELVKTKLINGEGELEDVEIPTPMYQMILKTLDEYCKRISVAPGILSNE